MARSLLRDRLTMRTLSVPVLSITLTLALLLPAREARASGCYLGAFASVDPAINCEVVVHQYAAYDVAPPTLYVIRDGIEVDVTGTIDKQTLDLPVEYPETDCDGDVTSSTTKDEPYSVYRLSIDGGFVGEALFAGGLPAGHIQVATTGCVEPAPPQPICGHLPLGCELGAMDEATDADRCGCAAGRGSGLALALAAVGGLLARAGRRRRGA